MLLLRWLWIGNGNDGEIPPIAVFWALRVLMFIVGFVLEDWAIHELIQSQRQRRIAVLLVASSYVTWTFQTHTFSNSIETLVVAWSLVLIERIVATPAVSVRLESIAGEGDTDSNSQERSSVLASTVLGIVAVFGVFNRITFPAFLLIPGLRLLPYYWKKYGAPCLFEGEMLINISPLSLIAILAAGLGTTALAITLDTAFYAPHSISWSELIRNPVLTPLNNVLYNLSPTNLAKHGLHPWYQHLLVNLPQLLGPATLLLFMRPKLSSRLYSAISGIVVLSLSPHQEARFLLPTVPLLLSSIRLPKSDKVLRVWVAAWIVFNIALGILMGTYHQGGVVPAQVFLSKQPDATQAVWWKTYMPPIWLLNGKNEVLRTQDVMGMKGELLLAELGKIATCDTPADRRSMEYLKEGNGTYLVAPLSATWIDPYLSNKGLEGLRFREVWRYRQHLNMDDLDFAEDGVWDTLSRVIGRRGLAIWRVTKSCPGVKSR